MDFVGQRLSEVMAQWIVTIFSAIGFLLGFFSGSFKLMMNTYMLGVFIALAVTTPEWPMFNQHPLKFISVAGRPSNWYAKQQANKPNPVSPAMKAVKKKSKR
mmetsp:Transcript_21599/g.41204  ORF Transcript_21599/g.41204 Transcript_21599/m.41204 type:complete len:102 (-) Transcript_21599:457-762(-)|eukprot:CAMPEP_0114229282 /NCGR_PEP_ID=MMETSP0058-20121206/2819_1 /TAXON_ID=36894 /ORGANISM="Pyramimonas parkeae, CCMP726" /LENGTH=101 /DNA_ID=CAMNT_0001340337 /DNA_START=108 /DNA_END=413 /DNA_ORIENTATION=+